jgi:hypothetical protein
MSGKILKCKTNWIQHVNRILDTQNVGIKAAEGNVHVWGQNESTSGQTPLLDYCSDDDDDDDDVSDPWLTCFRNIQPWSTDF